MKARTGGKDWRRRRNVVLARDGRCLRCGTREHLTIDHVRPLSQGGTNRIDNLQTLCKWCNWTKGNHSIDYRGLAPVEAVRNLMECR